MQARALARRCPSGSFTVLGDLAQATGPWIRDSWDELAEHLASTQVNVETLTIGYRVPAPVLDLASRQLPLISPGLEAPRSIRPGLGVPLVARVGADELVAEAFTRALACVDAGMTTAVVLPDALYDEVMDAAEDLDVAWGDGREGDFSAPLTLVPASLSKGLEFDAVILAGPDQIVDTTNQGRRLLYVAMTRCTQQLTIVHSAALPTGLDHLDTPDEGSDIQPDEEEAPIERTPDLADLIALLDDEDRAMVQHLVRRLLHRARTAVPEEDLT
jgi:DNA helicase IV